MTSTKQRDFKVGDLVWWETGFGRSLALVLEIPEIIDDSLDPEYAVYEFATQETWYAEWIDLKHAYRQSE